jgi:hypothetical protein
MTSTASFQASLLSHFFMDLVSYLETHLPKGSRESAVITSKPFLLMESTLQDHFEPLARKGHLALARRLHSQFSHFQRICWRNYLKGASLIEPGC